MPLPPKHWRNNDGYICDDGCHSWRLGACTCGLLVWLIANKAMDKARSQIPFLRWRALREFLIMSPECQRIARITDCRHGVHIDKECEECEREYDQFNDAFGDDAGQDP